MGFTVSTDELRASASNIEQAADAVAKIDLAAAVGLVGAAMSSGKAARAAGRLATRWAEETSSWATAARAHGAKLTASATSYDETDQAAADTVTGTGRLR